MSMSRPQFQKRNDLADSEVRQLICELCHHFYHLGWVSGTGGGLTLRREDLIYMAPSGVQKERIHPADIFVLDTEGEVLQGPAQKALKVSACRPLFMHAYKHRKAGAVVHSHGMFAMLATLLFEHHVPLQNQEMLKGIQGMGAFDLHEVPIIPNTAQEEELTDTLERAMLEHPKTHAILVRGHGVYVWGKDWVQAKTQAECYHYLFEAVVRMHQLGVAPDGTFNNA
ncbi:MAG: methylthioribulose 1-phosphate dehydratase [Myxococcota bacterium]